MMFLADATNSEAKEQDRKVKEQEQRKKEREEYEERMRRREEERMLEEGKVKCGKCGRWYKKGRSIAKHQQTCKGL
jgi:hypothetical protein